MAAVPAGYIALLLLALSIPAYFINLGLFAFTGDESIRSLVALEMDLSGNFIASTMHGAPYINKPPLFNWMVWLSAKLWGSWDEIPARLVTLAMLASFGLLVYQSVRKEFGWQYAFIAAFSVITSGRLLFYDAMLGLIDTTFSAVVYCQMMVLYYFGIRNKWQAFFVVSYVLMAAGFLLKGMPAVVFQAFSLPAALWFFGRFRLLFNKRHIIGMAAAGLILGAYLLAYAQYRPLEMLLPNLLNESVKRTAVEFGWLAAVGHLFTFPFESIYHFLPYSLLIIGWFDRRIWKIIRANDLVYFHVLMMMVNLPVYWTSVQVMPRYLLMFIPLFNIPGLYLLRQHEENNRWQAKAVYLLLGILLSAAPVAMLALPFIPQVNYLPNIEILAVSLALVLGLIARLYFSFSPHRLWWFLAGILVIRIGFNLVVLPARHDESIVTRARRDIRVLADKYQNREWYVYHDSTYIREPASYYLTSRLNRIIPRTSDPYIPGALYLIDPADFPYFPGTLIDTFQTDYPELRLYLYNGQ